MNLHVEDKVMVRKDLNNSHCNFGMNDEMERMAGMIVTISRFDAPFHEILINEDSGKFHWSEGCFRPAIRNTMDVEI